MILQDSILAFYSQIKLFAYKVIWITFLFTFNIKKNSSGFLVQQRAKSNEQRARSNEQQAKSNEQRAKVTSNEHKLTSNEQKVTSNKPKLTSNEQNLTGNKQLNTKIVSAVLNAQTLKMI